MCWRRRVDGDGGKNPTDSGDETAQAVRRAVTAEADGPADLRTLFAGKAGRGRARAGSRKENRGGDSRRGAVPCGPGWFSRAERAAGGAPFFTAFAAQFRAGAAVLSAGLLHDEVQPAGK